MLWHARTSCLSDYMRSYDPCIDFPILFDVSWLMYVFTKRLNELKVLWSRYIAYARQHCSPRLGEAAKKLLLERWLAMRAAVALSDGCMPVTVRSLTV